MGISTDIYEDSFAKNSVPSYNLSALVGADRFSFLGYDDHQKVQFLKSYTFHNPKEQEQKSILHQTYTQDGLLKSPFYTRSVAISNHYNSLVPDRLFRENHEQIYLEKIVEVSPDNTFGIDYIPELGIRNVYLIDKGVKSILDGYFPGAQIVHDSTMFIKGARSLAEHRTGHQIYLNLSGNQFQVVLFEGQDLLFSNNYTFQNPNDFIYFTLLVFEQFKLKPEAIPLYLAGEIVKDSEIYKLIYRYIRHIHFVQLPGFLNFGAQIQSIPSHLFFNLYCSKLCG